MKKWLIVFVGVVFPLFANCPVETDIKPNCCIGPTLCTSGPLIEDGYDCGAWNIEIGFLLEQVRLSGSQTAYSIDSLDNLSQV